MPPTIGPSTPILRSGFILSSLVAIALIPAAVMVCPAVAQEKDDPSPPLHAGVPWLTAAVGLEQAAKERKAMLVVAPGGEAASQWALLEKGLFSSRGVRKLLGKFVTIDASLGNPDPLKRVIGSTGKEPTLLLLDFRGTVLQRWRPAPPKRRDFTKAAKAALELNHALAKRFKAVAALLPKIEYALQIKDHRKAVELYLQASKVKLPVEAEFAKRLAAARAGLDQAFREREKKAIELEEALDYLAAIDKYEKMMEDFPFPEKVLDLRRRITRLWSLVNL